MTKWLYAMIVFITISCATECATSIYKAAHVCPACPAPEAVTCQVEVGQVWEYYNPERNPFRHDDGGMYMGPRIMDVKDGYALFLFCAGDRCNADLSTIPVNDLCRFYKLTVEAPVDKGVK